MIDPDEDAQPVVSHHLEKEVETPGTVGGRFQKPGLHCGHDGADGSILIVPGGIRRHAQERVDDRRHPQTPAQHSQGLFHHADDAVAGEQPFQRSQAALQKRVEQDDVDAEERRRQRPVDNARERLVVEEAHRTGRSSQIDGAPLAEERVDDIVLHRHAGLGIEQRSILEKFCHKYLDLGGVHIPGESAAGASSQNRAQRVQPPGLQMAAVFSPDPQQIAEQVDSGVGRNAHDCSEQETPEAGCGRKAYQHRQRNPHAYHRAARHSRPVAVVAPYTPVKGLASVKAFDNGLEKGKRQGAKQGRAGDGAER